MKNNFLLMGWPFGCPPSVNSPYQNDYDMLSIENTIINILTDNKCDFTYKVHPDRKNETLDLYKDKIKRYELNKFEKIYNNYDTLVFSYPHTTTFFYSFKKEKKIIFFDNEDENYLPKQGYDFIYQRARVIKYRRIKKNNFEFETKKIF